MSFELSREHEEFRRTVRDFAEDRIAPHVAQWDRDHHFPVEVVQQLLTRDRHRVEAARAVSDALTVVRSAHAERSWIRLTYVGDDGTSHHTVARPVTQGSGTVRISGPDGTRTLPLARVVSAAPAPAPRD